MLIILFPLFLITLILVFLYLLKNKKRKIKMFGLFYSLFLIITIPIYFIPIYILFFEKLMSKIYRSYYYGNYNHFNFRPFELAQLGSILFFFTLPLWLRCYFQWKVEKNMEKKTKFIWIKCLVSSVILTIILSIGCGFLIMIMDMSSSA